MRIILAPMEGLVDAPIRETLTGVGGIDRCVTEFVRVTHGMLPPRVFYKYAPDIELFLFRGFYVFIFQTRNKFIPQDLQGFRVKNNLLYFIGRLYLFLRYRVAF